VLEKLIYWQHVRRKFGLGRRMQSSYRLFYFSLGLQEVMKVANDEGESGILPRAHDQ
jgi:hypothetical protein